MCFGKSVGPAPVAGGGRSGMTTVRTCTHRPDTEKRSCEVCGSTLRIAPAVAVRELIGIGDAAKAAKAAYDKIDWYAFNMLANGRLGTPLNSPDAKKNIQKAIDDVGSEWKKTVKPVVDALHILDTTAKAAAAGKLAKHKSDAAVALDMAKDARWLVGSLQTNGIFFTDVYKKCKTALDAVDTAQASFKKIQGETKQYLTALLSGLAKVQANIDNPKKIWESDVKQQGRSVSNNIAATRAWACPSLEATRGRSWLPSTQFGQPPGGSAAS